MQRLLITAILGAPYCWLFAQAPAEPLSFEVVSIKLSPPDTPGTILQLQPGGTLRATNITVKQLIAFGYGVRDFQVSGGPPWINSDRYNIQGRSEHAPGVPASVDEMRNMTDGQRKTYEQQMRERVRSMLAERFELTVQHETKEGAVYALVVAKGGPKLKENTDATGRPGVFGRRRGELTGTAANMQLLTQVLSNQLGRPVVDKTGLTSRYDFQLQWTPDAGQVSAGIPPPGVEAPPPPDPNGPDVFTAIQEQLGLRLESQKAPVDMVVIDRIEKPSEN